MRVLIYEPQFLGHNLGHVALLVQEIAKMPCDVTIATSRQAIESVEFEVHLGKLPAQVQMEVIDGFRLDSHQRRVRTGGMAGSAAVYRGLCQAIDRTRPDHVFVPYGNTLARVACLPLGLSRCLRRTGAEAETLLVGGRFMLSEQSQHLRLRQRISYHLLARGPWSSVFHLDLAAVAALHAGHDKLRRTVKLMPEPVSIPQALTKFAARQLLKLPTDGRYAVIVGLIEERKGLGPLIDALSELPADCRLLLAGKCDPPTRELLQQQHGDLLRTSRLIALDRYLTREEFDASIYAADVVAAFYPAHRHSSSIVVAAAAARRPVVGASVGWIGRSIESFDLGATCQPDQAGSLPQALLQVMKRSDRFRLSERGERFVAFNTAANFAATWTVRLRERLGLSPSPELVSWDWVSAHPIAAPRQSTSNSASWLRQWAYPAAAK